MQSSPHFTPLPLSGYNLSADALTANYCSDDVLESKDRFLKGRKTLWGIPFELGPETGCNLVYSGGDNVLLELNPVSARYLVFVHAADIP